MGKVMQVVAFTDGRTVETVAFDARKDSEFSVASLVARMRENGWVPVKGSNHLIDVENGVARPYIARVNRGKVWQVG